MAWTLIRTSQRDCRAVAEAIRERREEIETRYAHHMLGDSGGAAPRLSIGAVEPRVRSVAVEVNITCSVSVASRVFVEVLPETLCFDAATRGDG